MDSAFPKNDCCCGMPQRWAADPKYPVQFDEHTNEYHLICDKSIAIMRYCFWCGGRLPESRRSELFTTPSDEEQHEIHALLSTAKSASDVMQILGKPDETFDWDEANMGSFSNVTEWKRIIRYSSRWRTLVLDVLEMPDGNIEQLTYGRYIGAPFPESIKLPRWWQFWKLNQ